MKKAPLVSVVMPVYNGERFIAEAIESVLGQGYRHFELLIVDDGSTDGTREVIARYRDGRIRLIVQKSNRGLIHSRNNAIAGARGEYIAFLDSDDTACRTRLAKQVAFLESNPDYAMVGAWVDVIDEQGRLTDIVVHRALERPDSEISPVLLGEIEQWLLRLRAANRSNAIYDTRCFERVLGEKWFSACRACSSAGLVSFLSYIRSPLCARGKIPLGKAASFFLRGLFPVGRRRE